MRWRGILILFVGIILAGGAVLYVQNMLAQQGQNNAIGSAEATPTPLVEIVIAQTNIPFGAEVHPEMVGVRPWPKEAVPADAFIELEKVLGDGNQERRRARRPIAAGEVILSGKLSDFGEKVTIAHIIDPTKRAMSIRVNDVSGVGGFVTPGDRVDIVMTRNVEKKFRADTILQNIRVRGVDQMADEDRDKPSVVRTVTVEVNPEEAQKLALAQQAGNLSLTLRNLENAEEAPLGSIDLNDLLGVKKRKSLKRVEQPSVTINRGGKRSRVSVPGG